MSYVTVDVNGRPYAVVDPADGALDRFLADMDLDGDVTTRPATAQEAGVLDAEKTAAEAAGDNPDNVVAVQL